MILRGLGGKKWRVTSGEWREEAKRGGGGERAVGLNAAEMAELRGGRKLRLNMAEMGGHGEWSGWKTDAWAGAGCGLGRRRAMAGSGWGKEKATASLRGAGQAEGGRNTSRAGERGSQGTVAWPG